MSLQALLDKNRNRETLSLNMEQRTSQQQTFDAERLAVKTVAGSRGEDPLDNIEALRDLEEQRALDGKADEAIDDGPTSVKPVRFWST